MTQKEMAEFFKTPLRTLENYESEKRQPPEWVLNLIIENLEMLIESKKEDK